MKKISIILAIFILQTACKKDPKICENYTELTDTKSLVDLSPLKNAPELLDTLNKYPTLQPSRISIDQYSTDVVCNVFYKGLKVFTAQYALHKSQFGIHTNGTLVDTIDVSLTPSINYQSAINIARKNISYKNTCISYRLGFYDVINNSRSPDNYKLVWLVQGENGYPYVYLDANTGQVYDMSDGIEF